MDYDKKPINPHRVFKELNDFFVTTPIYHRLWNIPRYGRVSFRISTCRTIISLQEEQDVSDMISPPLLAPDCPSDMLTVAVMGILGLPSMYRSLPFAQEYVPVIVVIVNNPIWTDQAKPKVA
jgi:hypothetical protein